MKQFQLTQFDEFNGEYHVWFGNRICCRFASKRNVREFLAETNRFLNRTMVELNELYIVIFTEYRRIWFTLMNFKNGVNVNLSQQERDMQKIIGDIADQFNRAGNTYHGTASGGWSFVHLQNATFMMKEITKQMIDLNKRRNNTIQYHTLEVLEERISLLESRLVNYPEVLPANCLGLKSNK